MSTAQRSLGLFLLLFAGCGTLLSGARSVSRNDNGEFEPVAGMAVTPQEALEKAEPYLDLTHQLRLQDREREDVPAEFETARACADDDTIVVKDGWYYVVRDHQTSRDSGFYLAHAVRVHGETGQLLPPE